MGQWGKQFCQQFDRLHDTVHTFVIDILPTSRPINFLSDFVKMFFKLTKKGNSQQNPLIKLFLKMTLSSEKYLCLCFKHSSFIHNVVHEKSWVWLCTLHSAPWHHQNRKRQLLKHVLFGQVNFHVLISGNFMEALLSHFVLFLGHIYEVKILMRSKLWGSAIAYVCDKKICK